MDEDALRTIESWFTCISGLSDVVDPFIVSELGELISQKLQVGRGAYAKIHLAKIPQNDVPVIVKVNTKVDGYGVERLTQHEAAILAHLEGRAGAPRLICCEPRAGIIVMECLGFNNLESLILDYELDDRDLLKIMLSLSKQVKELNDCGIVHADLKPDNVMMTYADGEPQAHLIDFGCSTKIGRRSHFGQCPQRWQVEVFRRPWYAAEIFQGRTLDHKADVVGLAFSLLFVMGEMRSKRTELAELVELGMNYNRRIRPSYDQFINYLEGELALLDTV